MKKGVKLIIVLLIVINVFTGCTSYNLNNKVSCKKEISESNSGYSLNEEKVYNYDDIKDVVIRFHVLANSDSDEDQNLKLKVRDRILEYLKPYMQEAESTEEARQIILDKEDEIRKVSLEVIKENGYNYGVRTELGRDNFPEKSYGNITLPQGNYEAIRVLIGKAEGHNWWCVMFPALCFIDITKGDMQEEESREELDKAVEENKKDDVKVKFKIVEIVKNFFK